MGHLEVKHQHVVGDFLLEMKLVVIKTGAGNCPHLQDALHAELLAVLAQVASSTGHYQSVGLG